MVKPPRIRSNVQRPGKLMAKNPKDSWSLLTGSNQTCVTQVGEFHIFPEQNGNISNISKSIGDHLQCTEL